MNNTWLEDFLSVDILVMSGEYSERDESIMWLYIPNVIVEYCA